MTRTDPTRPESPTGWRIDFDHLAGPDETSRIGTGQTYADAAASSSMSVRVSRDLPALPASSSTAFRLYDDDGELYYSGRIARSWLEGPEHLAFGPLDFGAADAGCTELRYATASGWRVL